jgi:hypothetical protein
VQNLYVRLKQTLRDGDVEGSIEQVEQILTLSTESLEAIGDNIGRTILALYREFVVTPVHRFYEEVAFHIEGSVAQRIQALLKPGIELTEEWLRKIDAVYRERLARELREHVRRHETDHSIQVIVDLLAPARLQGKGGETLPIHIGNILGTMENDQPEVDRILSRLRAVQNQHGIDPALVARIEQAKTERLGTIYSSRMETREVEWNRVLISTVVELKRYLPLPNAIGSPTLDEIDKFEKVVRAILRTPFYEDRLDHFADVVVVLVEFCPKELSLAGALSGVEQRMYLTMGPKAQMVISRVFQAIGNIAVVCQEFLRFARGDDHHDYQKYAIELMGALRAPQFTGFLIEALHDKRYQKVHEEVVESLGQIGGPEATDVLVSELGRVVRARVIDPPRLRQASRIITALGNIGRSKHMTEKKRSALIERVISLIPSDELRLKILASLALFHHSPEHLSARSVDWAVETLAECFWLADEQPHFARGSDRQRSILGYRQKIVDTLVAIGRPGLPKFLKTIEKHYMRYGGAYLAIAEVLEKTGDERAVPIIEKLLCNAFAADDEEIGTYQKEYYWDSTEAKRKPLTKDKIVASLVYAIDKIGGEKAEELLLRLFRQAQGGHLSPPGPETANFLLDANMRIAKRKGVSAFAPPAQEAHGKPLESEKDTKERAAEGELVETLTRKNLLVNRKQRRMQKVAALRALAERRSVGALDAMIAQLGDKDKLVRDAASSALLEFATPGTAKHTIENLINHFLAALEHADRDLRKDIELLLMRLHARCPIVRQTLEGILQSEPKGAVRAEVSKILLIIERESPSPGGPLMPPPPSEPVKSEQEKPEAPSPQNHVERLEKKRRYLLARQEWIRGGKKGPPPKMPA